ncbi:MAG: PH domain-containing protein [Gammaproteobacteria bacterium]|nr:PH domain-containing protein [Gammaproteobacteria bacterium]
MAKSSNAVHANAAQAVSFRSAIGKRAVTRLLVPIGPALLGPALLWAGGIKAAVGAMLLSAALAFEIWIVYRYARYFIVGETLVICRAFEKRRIHLDAIVSVRRRAYREIWATHRPSDDFALGTNFLEIQYNGDSRVMVSPRDEDAFVAAIGQPVLADTR